MIPLANVPIKNERDVVAARQVGRRVAGALGFEILDQTRIMTAISELARNAQRYAGSGSVELAIAGDALRVTVRDRGPGIAQLDEILRGRYVSRSGMGLGILGVKRLMDRFEIESGATGTKVVFERDLLRKVAPATLAALREDLAREARPEPVDELAKQSGDLLRALEALQERHAQVEALNRELEDTNRGVVALYAELDEKAAALQRASEAKSRFFSSMSHEFRTPLNSIISLSRLLLDRIDGDLGEEQERQVSLIRKSAQELAEIVDDLLDLAKVEAGKIEVRPKHFTVGELFGALRGAIKPLVAQATVALHFDDRHDALELETDETKLAQILRNFLSNALKYTAEGEVRVAAEALDRDLVRFAVTDTGIGIGPDDQEKVFEEFIQIENPLQRRVKGTGLGLPLSRRFSELLGGTVGVESEVGRGSTFFVTIPRVYGGGGGRDG